jgi:hypothetical protein
MLIEACIFYKCKGPNLPKTISVFHHHACKDLLTKKCCDCRPKQCNPFIPWLPIVIYFKMVCYSKVNKQMNMSNFNISFHGSNVIHFIVFDKLFI